MHLKMQLAATLFGLIAIATGNILSTAPSVSTHKTLPVTLDQSQDEICQLHNVQKGAPLSFISPQQMPIISVVVNLYTSINCSARNFCNITWFKDEHPVELKDYMTMTNNNQILEFQRADYKWKGNYTCVVTDGKEFISRTVQLFITANPWKRPPLPLPGPLCTNQTASISSMAEFFCFFFAGDTIDNVKVTWYKRTELGKWVPVSALNSTETQYEEMLDYSQLRTYSGSGLQPTAGKHLYIERVTREAYGDYRPEATSPFGTESAQPLSLSEPPPPPKADLTAVITASVVVACVLISLVALAVTWYFVKLDFMIWRKNRFGALEDDDGKTYDAFISYADEDLQFALDIRQRLEQSGYSVCVGDINFELATPLVEEIILALSTSRRCLIVISPDFIRARHSALQVDVATEQMMQRQIKIVPVIYHDISSVNRDEMPLLKRILSNVRVVKWDEKNPEKLTKQLLVHMPPRRPAGLLGGDIEERNLLRAPVASDRHDNVDVDGSTPFNDRDNAAGHEMNNFPHRARDTGARNQYAIQGQMGDVLPAE